MFKRISLVGLFILCSVPALVHADNAITSLTANNFDSFIQSAEIVVVKFFATWCGPCKMMIPRFIAAANSFTERCAFGEVDVDQGRSIVNRYGVGPIPTIIFFKNGRDVHREVGTISLDKLRGIIQNMLQG